MKTSLITISVFLCLVSQISTGQNYTQFAEVISSGGGNSSAGGYTNFDAIGETLVNSDVSGGNYRTSIGFLYASDIINGIENIRFYNSIKIFPNPINDIAVIQLKTPDAIKDLKIKVHNSLGQIIYSEHLDIPSGHFKKTISLGKNDPGVYFIYLKTNEGVLNRKVILK